jgi:hypothetical protein
MPETDGERERDAATLLTHKNEKEIFLRFDHGPTGRRGPHARTSRTPLPLISDHAVPRGAVQVEAEVGYHTRTGVRCL